MSEKPRIMGDVTVRFANGSWVVLSGAVDGHSSPDDWHEWLAITHVGEDGELTVTTLNLAHVVSISGRKSP